MWKNPCDIKATTNIEHIPSVRMNITTTSTGVSAWQRPANLRIGSPQAGCSNAARPIAPSEVTARCSSTSRLLADSVNTTKKVGQPASIFFYSKSSTLQDFGYNDDAQDGSNKDSMVIDRYWCDSNSCSSPCLAWTACSGLI